MRGRVLSRGAVGCWLALLSLATFWPAITQAQTITQSGNVSVTAVVLPPPPTLPAIIESPDSGSRFRTTPLVVSGTCQAGTLVRIYNDGQLAGSVACEAVGTFRANITLHMGLNSLTALNFDAAEQAGPASSPVTVYVEEPELTAEQTEEFAAITGEQADAAPLDLSQSQRLFEGSIIEPVGKILDLDTQVDANTNQAIAVVVNGVFVISLVFLTVLLIT